VYSEETLSHLPGCGEYSLSLERVVNPTETAFVGNISYATTSSRIVFHNLAGADSSFLVNLKVYHVSGFGYAEFILIHKTFHDKRVKMSD
jgi:hypothetical protein